MTGGHRSSSSSGRFRCAAATCSVSVREQRQRVGKSTVATALACVLAADGGDGGLFDANVYGPNAPELLSTSGPVHSEEGNPLPVDIGGLEMMSVGLLSSSAPLVRRGAMAHDALSELFEENDVPVLGVVSDVGEFVCDDCGTVHDLFEGSDPVDTLDAPRLAEIPFASETHETPAPTADALPDHARDLAENVRARLAEVWTVDLPERAVDIRGVPPEDRRKRVREGFEALDPGEEFYLVSDRDPTPVRDFLLDLVDADPGRSRPLRGQAAEPRDVAPPDRPAAGERRVSGPAKGIGGGESTPR